MWVASQFHVGNESISVQVQHLDSDGHETMKAPFAQRLWLLERIDDAARTACRNVCRFTSAKRNASSLGVLAVHSRFSYNN